MIDHLGLGRLAVLLVAALLVFGPDRLPEIAAQIGRGLRQLRSMLEGMSSEVRSGIGPEVADLDLASLHPKRLLAGLMAEEEPTASTLTATSPEAEELQPTEYADRPVQGIPFDLPVGSDALTLLTSPIDVSHLTAPWDEPATTP